MNEITFCCNLISVSSISPKNCNKLFQLGLVSPSLNRISHCWFLITANDNDDRNKQQECHKTNHNIKCVDDCADCVASLCKSLERLWPMLFHKPCDSMVLEYFESRIFVFERLKCITVR